MNKHPKSIETDDESGGEIDSRHSSPRNALGSESEEEANRDLSPKVATKKVAAKKTSEQGSDDELDAISRDTRLGEKFRVNAKVVMLTYPQSGVLTEAKVHETINARWPVKAYIIATELHEDGKPHIHFYVEFLNKINVVNPAAFDIVDSDEQNHHPNVRTVQRKHKSAVQHYVMKGGKFTEHKVDMFPTSRNFMRSHQDFTQWVRYRKQAKMGPIKWPITLPNGMLIEKPVSEKEKKRHWIIKGAPDMGKTTWVNNQFAGQKVWLRPATDDLPFDDYDGQEVLIYDDVNVARLKDELIAAANCWKLEQRVPGRTRYQPRYWPTDQLRTIIIINNDWPEWKEEGWACARFNHLDLQHWIPDYLLAEAKLPNAAAFSPPRLLESPPPAPPRIFRASEVVPESQELIERDKADAIRNSARKLREHDLRGSQDAARIPSALDDDDFVCEESQDPYE